MFLIDTLASVCNLIKECIEEEEEEEEASKHRDEKPSQEHDRSDDHHLPAGMESKNHKQIRPILKATRNAMEGKRVAGKINNKRKAGTKPMAESKKVKQTLEIPGDLPEEFKARIKERAQGRKVKKQVMVIQKTLTKTDVRDHQNRLSIPVNQVANMFLSEEEEKILLGRNANGHYNVMSVGMIEPTGQVDRVNLARWVMGKDGGKLPSISYVLNGEGWKKIKTCNRLKEGDTLQLWAVQIEDELCIVLIKLA